MFSKNLINLCDKQGIMTVETVEISISADRDCGIVDITEKVSEAVRDSTLKDGTVTVFCAGSTGGVTTMEFEHNLSADFSESLDRLIPLNEDYHHHKTWGDYNGGSHLRSMFVGTSLTIPFISKKLTLGTWQQIVCINFDRMKRSRRLILQLVGE